MFLQVREDDHHQTRMLTSRDEVSLKVSKSSVSLQAVGGTHILALFEKTSSRMTPTQFLCRRRSSIKFFVAAAFFGMSPNRAFP